MKPVVSKNAVHTGAYESSDKFTSSNGILPIGGEEGDNSPLETQDYESEQYTQLGEDGDSETANEIEIADGDSLVKVDQIIDNFKKLAGGRLRGHTPRQYELIFRRFARTVNLEDYSRRRLQGHIGKELLLQYLLNRSDVPAPSVRTHNVALKCVWIEGLSIPYPIDARRHLGELPEAQRRQSPRDIDVIPWIKALEHEEELYLKGLVLIIFQLGVRPSHACLFRWKHIHYGMDGKPEAVITTGREPGNKKMTPVKARLPEDISNVLAELKKTMPDALSEDPILPHRKPNGQLERNVAMRSVHYSIQWRRFERKHMLNHLRPVDLRHWVSTTCRKANLSLPARNALQGHKFRNENQGEGYDNPQDVDLLAEQERILPYGPIGVICPNMEITQALPVELTDALGGCMKGEILPSQLAEKVTAYLLRQIKKPENTMVA